MRSRAGCPSGSVKALAYLRGADLLLAQATLPPAKAQEVVPASDTTDAATDTEKADDEVATPNTVELAAPQIREPEELLKDARKMYQAVADDKNVHVVLQINGLLGLASVAEAQGDWDAADAAYDQAVTQAGTTYAVLAQQAKGRKAKLAQLKKPVHFAKALPKPAPKPVSDEPKAEFKAPSLDLNLSTPALPGITDEDSKSEE